MSELEGRENGMPGFMELSASLQLQDLQGRVDQIEQNAEQQAGDGAEGRGLPSELGGEDVIFLAKLSSGSDGSYAFAEQEYVGGVLGARANGRSGTARDPNWAASTGEYETPLIYAMVREMWDATAGARVYVIVGAAAWIAETIDENELGGLTAVQKDDSNVVAPCSVLNFENVHSVTDDTGGKATVKALPDAGSQYKVLQCNSGGEAVWDWVRAHE